MSKSLLEFFFIKHKIRYNLIMNSIRNISLANTEYKEAIDMLNTLQTNAQVLHQLKSNKTLGQENNIERTNKYLLRSGVNVDQLEKKLSVIHVSGTKGKGSTCALCESILHSHGYKTGYFSSPHLVAVRERIRINQSPLSEWQFSRYFWKVFKSLSAAKEYEGDMPSYFKFLYVMALNVFLEESVDVAIIEVGIGGRYDCTNIFEKTPVVGISSLGLDHTSLLGNTIEAIAWQKGGIMKPGSLAFTSPQPRAAMRVLQQCALDSKTSLWEVPALSEYDWQGKQMAVSLTGKVQTINAALALQLSNAWINRDRIENSVPGLLGVAKTFKIEEPTSRGLANCMWPGRYQTLIRKSINGKCHYYIDGAHTSESIELCAQWFYQSTHKITTRKNCCFSLVYNLTGDRDATELLAPLVSCHFDRVFFCPNMVAANNSSSENYNVTSVQQLDRCETNRQVWLELEKQSKVVAKEVRVCTTVMEVLRAIESQEAEQHILVTGSLHLVGAVLSVLDPNLSASFKN